MNFCEYVYNNGQSFMLPRPFTEHVTVFSKVVGPNYESEHKTAGSTI